MLAALDKTQYHPALPSGVHAAQQVASDTVTAAKAHLTATQKATEQMTAFSAATRAAIDKLIGLGTTKTAGGGAVAGITAPTPSQSLLVASDKLALVRAQTALIEAQTAAVGQTAGSSAALAVAGFAAAV